MRKSKLEKQQEKEFETIIAQEMKESGAQINIFDLGKVDEAGKAAQRAGKDIREAVKAAIALYRKN